MERIPLLKIGSIVLVSIQTELDDATVEILQDSILKEIDENEIDGVLIDITTLEIVDSFIARVLSDTARMAHVMNTDVVLVGMRPVVTMTLLEMGLEFPGVRMGMDVESGLKQLGFALVRLDKSEAKQSDPSISEMTNGSNWDSFRRRHNPFQNSCAEPC